MGTSEKQILESARAGDTEAFRELIIPYEKLVFNIAYRMLGSAEDACDISQEVWIKVYKNLDKCTNYDFFKAWLIRITNNTCIDELRKRKVRISPDSYDKQLETEDSEMELQIKSDEETPEEQFLSAQRKAALEKAIQKLSPVYKSVIIYRDIQGLSYEEIAKATEQNIGTVKSRISRARSTLKGFVSEMMEQNEI